MATYLFQNTTISLIGTTTRTAWWNRVPFLTGTRVNPSYDIDKIVELPTWPLVFEFPYFECDRTLLTGETGSEQSGQSSRHLELWRLRDC